MDTDPDLYIAQLCSELTFCIYFVVAICSAQKKRETVSEKKQVETDEKEVAEYDKLPEQQENEKLAE